MNQRLHWGQTVRINHPEGWYHGDTGTIQGQGRWGHLIIEIIRDGTRYTPEIKRGYLEPVQEETTDAVERQKP